MLDDQENHKPGLRVLSGIQCVITLQHNRVELTRTEHFESEHGRVKLSSSTPTGPITVILGVQYFGLSPSDLNTAFDGHGPDGPGGVPAFGPNRGRLQQAGDPNETTLDPGAACDQQAMISNDMVAGQPQQPRDRPLPDQPLQPPTEPHDSRPGADTVPPGNMERPSSMGSRRAGSKGKRRRGPSPSGESTTEDTKRQKLTNPSHAATGFAGPHGADGKSERKEASA